MIIQVKDYFKPVMKSNKQDVYLVMQLRNQLNSFYTVGEQYDFIREYRSDPANREFDLRVFGFPRNSRIYDPSNFEKSQVNKYYMNVATEVEIEDESAKNKRKRNKAKVKFVAFSAAFSMVFGLVQTANKYGGLLGLPHAFRHTPFGICSLELDEVSDRFSKSLVDDQGIVRYLPGTPTEYAGYEEEREAILAGEIPEYNEEGELVRGYKVFRSEDWVLGEDQRGIGTFGLLDRENAIRAQIDMQRDYVIVMHWEYVGFWLAEPDGGVDLPGRTEFHDRLKIDECPTEDIIVDAQYRDWLLQQKVVVFNPVNHKSVVCELSFGENAITWGPANASQCAGILTQAAIDDLEYDVMSGVELDVYFIPPDLGEVNEGLLESQLHLVDNNCQLLRTAGSRGGKGGVGGQPLPGGAGHTEADGGIDNGWVASAKDDDWLNTITDEYREKLVKYGFWPDKAKSTACATYVSIYLYEKYGDIPAPTASTAVLMGYLNNNPNYTKLGKWQSGYDIPKETVFLRTPGTAGKRSGHTYMYVGEDVTGVAGKGFISASMNDYGPIPRGQNSTASFCDMFIHN